jgi:radical SAM protein with 4Fe4S-binding SPASM domain
MRIENSNTGVPFFPFPIQPSDEGDNYTTENHLMAKPLRLNQQAAEVLRLADGETEVSTIVARLVELYPDAGGAESVRPSVFNLLRRLTRDELVWWRDVPLEPVPVASPASVFCEITAACNLRCRHCVVAAGKRERGELSTDRWLGLMEEMAEFGIAGVAFSGGEPLIHPQFEQIVERARSLGMLIQVATNGTMVTSAVACWLKGLDAEVQVSLDGATPEVHDRMRPGREAFVRTVEGIRALVAAGHEVTIGTVVSRLNVDEIPALVTLAESLGVSHFRLIPFVPKGRGMTFADMELPRTDMKKLTCYIHDLRNRTKLTITPMEFEDLMDGHMCAEPFDPKRNLGCSGAVAYATITPTGELLPCHFFAGVRADSVVERPFPEVWRRSRFLNYFRHLTVADLHGGCRECKWLSRCGGSCRAVNFAKGDLFGTNHGCWIAEETQHEADHVR